MMYQPTNPANQMISQTIEVIMASSAIAARSVRGDDAVAWIFSELIGKWIAKKGSSGA
jgi:hypothetical protein